MANEIFSIVERAKKMREENVSNYCKSIGVDYDSLSEASKSLFTMRYLDSEEQKEKDRIAKEEEDKKKEEDKEWDERLERLIKSIPPIFKSNGIPDIEDDYYSVVSNLIKDGTSMLLYGDNGVGKSHLAWAVDIYFTRQHRSVIHHEMFELKSILTDISMSDGITSDEVYNRFVSGCDVLIVDEVEKISMTDSLYQNFAYLINKRYENLKQTILFANGTFKSLANLLGKSIMSRFTSKSWKAKVFELTGKDRRK